METCLIIRLKVHFRAKMFIIYIVSAINNESVYYYYFMDCMVAILFLGQDATTLCGALILNL